MRSLQTFALFAACLGVLLSQARAQEQDPAARRWRSEGFSEEVRNLVEEYRSAPSDAQKDRIRAELKKHLEESDRAARPPADLERLRAQAALAAREAARAGDEALESVISQMQSTINRMLEDYERARDEAVNARLNRLLSPGREMRRP